MMMFLGVGASASAVASRFMFSMITVRSMASRRATPPKAMHMNLRRGGTGGQQQQSSKETVNHHHHRNNNVVKDGVVEDELAHVPLPRELCRTGRLILPAMFTVGFVSVSSCTALILEHERHLRERKTVDRLLSMYTWRSMFGSFGQQQIQNMNGWWGKNTNTKYSSAEGPLEPIRLFWKERTLGERVAFGIIGINTLVFAAWRLAPKRILAKMEMYFIHWSGSDRLVSHVLCSFSHKTPVHLGMNMLALYSFGSKVCDNIGPEQFLALYLSGAVVSSFASMATRVLMGVSVGSLGASGAIFSIFAASVYLVPDSSVYLIIMPTTAISSSTALTAAMVFDLAGVLLRWRVLDHAAHLGGALFGLYFMDTIREILWARGGTIRTTVLDSWQCVKSYVNKIRT